MNVFDYNETYKVYRELYIEPVPTSAKYQPKRSQKIKNKRRKGKKRK